MHAKVVELVSRLWHLASTREAPYILTSAGSEKMTTGRTEAASPVAAGKVH